MTKPAKRASRAPHIVKSAARTLEILELFDEIQEPLSIVSVSSALNYPQSSTSALLRSLVHLGYLKYDTRARMFFPTDRVPLLGSWISPPLFEEAALPRLMRAIYARAKHGALLATRNGDSAQYIHVLNQSGGMGSHIKLGMKRPLATSGVGLALLSAMQDSEVRRLFHRINAQRRSAAAPVSLPELIATLAEVRQRGYAYSENRVVSGYGMLAVRIPASLTAQPLVVGVGGACDEIRAKQHSLVTIVQEEIEHYLGNAKSAPQNEAFRSTKADSVAPVAMRHAERPQRNLFGGAAW